jgi:hypothetical protein
VVDGGLMVWASEMTLCCGKGDRAHERKIERGQAGAGGGEREWQRRREGQGRDRDRDTDTDTERGRDE